MQVILANSRGLSVFGEVHNVKIQVGAPLVAQKFKKMRKKKSTEGG
jgi:hypothetical protein